MTIIGEFFSQKLKFVGRFKTNSTWTFVAPALTLQNLHASWESYMGKKIALLLILLVSTSQAFADLYCRWDPVGRPSSFMMYKPKQKVILTLTGWPQRWHKYSGVKKVKGLPPYGNQGITLTVFGDVPAVTLMYTDNGTLWYDQNTTTYPYEAYWDKLPGGPPAEFFGPNRGVCWTRGLQPTNHNQNR
jgi:hypothetical protein